MVTFKLFIKAMAIMETGNVVKSNKGYYGRYQLCRKYIPYYMERLHMKASISPTEWEQRRIMYLIYKDTKKYISKRGMKLSMFNMRMVYMLGRGYFTKYIKGTLPISIMASNLPSSIKCTKDNFKKYWKTKVEKVLTVLV